MAAGAPFGTSAVFFPVLEPLPDGIGFCPRFRLYGGHVTLRAKERPFVSRCLLNLTAVFP